MYTYIYMHIIYTCTFIQGYCNAHRIDLADQYIYT